MVKGKKGINILHVDIMWTMYTNQS